MEKFALFLAHSFAREKLSPSGEFDSQFPSDAELAEQIAQWITQFSHGRIELIRTQDPLRHYISEGVRRDICRADGVLCVFTKRTKDHLKGLWIPSTYVISEGSAALMQFPSEQETHRRLFGLIEEGVDPEQLGMAFHGNKTAIRFRRDDMNTLEGHVRRIVDRILDTRSPVPPRAGYEYLAIDKVVSIWRSGWVWVETRHRYRFMEDLNSVSIPHKIWRVSSALPELETLTSGTPASKTGFLRVMPINCGHHDPDKCRCEIRPGPQTQWPYERNFVVHFPEIRVRAGEELGYEIVWGYPRAFHSRPPAGSQNDQPNSVGLRTGERGTVGSGSLTLKFERDWDGEPSRTLEGPPRVFTTDSTDLPGAYTPEEFFHKTGSWQLAGELQPCPKRSCTMSEVYYWAASPFHGMAKATWTPFLNYFDASESAERTTPKTSAPTEKS